MTVFVENICIDDVLSEKCGAVGLITLNRPRALNALNSSMVEKITTALQRFAADRAVQCVVVVSASDKAFCAGGDIRAVTSCPLEDGAALFRAEYRLNHMIATYPKPYISVVDGVCMGGGVGISAHGTHCLATENALFAMPEVAIGLFPDVGVAHVLARSRYSVGGRGWAEWFVLTGARIGREMAAGLGLCSAAIARDDVARLVSRLTAGASVEDLDFVQPLAPVSGGQGVPDDSCREIVDAFSAAGIEEILFRLEAQGTDRAREVVRLLESGCPVSLKMALWHVREAQKGGSSLRDVLERDYCLACFCLQNGNFREGVRAALIDRDKAPRWSPPLLADVDDGAFMSAAPIGGVLFDFDDGLVSPR